MKLEFENIHECLEFADAITRNRNSDVKITTEEMMDNRKWLHHNRLNEYLAILAKHDLNLDESIKEIWEAIGFNPKDNQSHKIQELEKEIESLKKQLNNNETAPDKAMPRKKKPVKKIPPEIRTKLKMQYPNGIGLSNVKQLYRDGHFQLSNSQKSRYTINDILKLKRYIEKGCTWDEINNTFKWNILTLKRIGYGIETGYYDKYFSEWEQLKAEQFYKKNNKKPVIENNPQKRREKGMR